MDERERKRRDNGNGIAGRQRDKGGNGNGTRELFPREFGIEGVCGVIFFPVAWFVVRKSLLLSAHFHLSP